MEIGLIKHDGKIGKLKDDGNYFLGNKGDNFQDKLQKSWSWENNYEYNEKVLLLTN